MYIRLLLKLTLILYKVEVVQIIVTEINNDYRLVNKTCGPETMIIND